MPSPGETRESLVRRLWNRRAAGLALSIALHLLVVALAVFVRTPGASYVVKRGEPLFVELPEAPGSAPAGDPSARTPGPPERGESPIARAPSPPPAPAAPRPAPRPAPSDVKPAPRATPSDPKPVPRPAPSETKPAPSPVRPEPPAPRDATPREPTPATAKATPPPAEPKAPETPAARPEAETPALEAKAGAGETPATAGGPPTGGRGQSPVDIRAALRPGGGGGGGRGGGRAGIEGEPIPLDSTNPRYSDYLDRVRRMIKEKWGYPCIKNTGTRDCEYKTAQLVIEFGVAKDGRVPFVNVLRSSGYPIYDEYAVNAVKFASPFPPVPDALSRTGFPIHATFNYIVDSGLTNLLR
jgi:TonB family protein